MSSQEPPTSPALTTSSYGILSPQFEYPQNPRARSSTLSSTGSSSSFEFANAETASEGYSGESGDEIVWNLSRDRPSGEDDFVLLSRRSVTQDAHNPAGEACEGLSAAAAAPQVSRNAIPLDDSDASPNRDRTFIHSTHTPGPQSWADENLDHEEDQKYLDDPHSTLGSKAGSVPSPNRTPKRDTGTVRRTPHSETLARSGPLASPTTNEDPLPHPKTKVKRKKGKAASARKAQAKDDSDDSGDGVKKAKKKKRGKKSAEPPVKPSAVDLSTFQEAQDYISSFLSSPEARSNTVCRLTFLQSLIIELGLISSVLGLPSSLKAARSFLKMKAFLNIREYMTVRGQGQEAIRQALYPTRGALVKALRTGRKSQRVSSKWVKDLGLQVLLVGCHFH